MTNATRKDYETLLTHWNRVYGESDGDDGGEADWRDLAPSPKLFDAARSLRDCENALDYGCGSGWAGILMAKCGCRRVTCADPAPNAVETVKRGAARYRVEDRVRGVLASDAWLSGMPDGSYDGFFCSNVLDVVPLEMAEEILRHAARVVKPGGPVIISLNYCMLPERIGELGLDCRDGNRIYMGGVLRLVNRTDGEWIGLLERYLTVERLEHFAWPGEATEARRLFYLRAGAKGVAGPRGNADEEGKKE